MAMRMAILILFLLCLSLDRGHALQEFEAAEGTRTLKQDVPQKHEVHCSRERSRTAWKIIEEYLTPFVEEEQYEIPSKCRLHPDNDMFREQEEHRIHVDTNEWRCGLCKKSFRAEKFLDQHFDNRHSNLIDDSQGRCLADLCGALHCDLMDDTKKSKNKCNPAAMSRNRHLCESLADSCFPTNQGSSASRLHELFLRQFCDAHTCNGGKIPFSRGGRKQSSVFYLALCILTVLLLPVFYLIVYLHRREMKSGIQDLKTHLKIRAQDKAILISCWYCKYGCCCIRSLDRGADSGGGLTATKLFIPLHCSTGPKLVVNCSMVLQSAESIYSIQL